MLISCFPVPSSLGSTVAHCHLFSGHCCPPLSVARFQSFLDHQLATALFFGVISCLPCLVSGHLLPTVTFHLYISSSSSAAVLRPSVHMFPGIRWCGAGLQLFPTACWWLTHPAAITGVSVSARWDSPGGCGGPSVLLLCNRRVLSP